MKKTLIFLYLCLAAAAGAALVSNWKGPYLGERTLWHLSRQYDAVVRNTTGTPTQTYEELLTDLGKFIKRFAPQKVTSVGYILRARLMTIQGKHAEAEREIGAALNAFAADEAIVIQLLLEQAQMYAIAGNTQGVFDTYQRIIKEHTLTRYGLQGPLILAKYFVNKRDAVRAKQAYIAAIAHYRELMKQYPDSQVEFQCRLLLAESYKFLQDWNKVLQIHKETLLKYANPDFWSRESLLYVVQSINSVTILRNKDFAAPVAIYSEFIQKYPGHPFNADLAEFIRRIRYMESQSPSAEKPLDAAAVDAVTAP